jgi:hypothetical protein
MPSALPPTQAAVSRCCGSTALGDEASQAGELTLVGIADPLAQAGDAAPVSVTARFNAPGLDPAPRPGFSGAAAVDVQGHFAGMVDLRPPVVAGGGSAAGATLVPADAVRAFLQAHGVPPAPPGADQHAPIAQSVLRVICVRK